MLHVLQQAKPFPMEKVVPEFHSSLSVSHLLCLTPQGAVLTPSMEHTMSLQPASMISPLAQQMSHLSLGSTGTVGGKLISCVSAYRGG